MRYTSLMQIQQDAVLAAPRKFSLVQLFGVLAVSLIPIFGGCSSLPPLDTPSGKPEVFIEGATKAQVMELLVLEVMGWGYSVSEQTDFSLVFIKDADDLGAQLLFGSQYNSTPQKQLRCTLAQTESGVKLVGRFSIVTNPGSGLEKGNDLSDSPKAAHDVQGIFLLVKEQVEGSADIER